MSRWLWVPDWPWNCGSWDLLQWSLALEWAKSPTHFQVEFVPEMHLPGLLTRQLLHDFIRPMVEVDLQRQLLCQNIPCISDHIDHIYQIWYIPASSIYCLICLRQAICPALLPLHLHPHRPPSLLLLLLARTWLKNLHHTSCRGTSPLSKVHHFLLPVGSFCWSIPTGKKSATLGLLGSPLLSPSGHLAHPRDT